MKKLMILCSGLMLAGAIAVNAQSADTTKLPAKTAIQSAPQQSNQMTQTKDQVKIKSTEVPASLRKTLEDPMYVGWENSTIWRNKTSDEYTVEMMSGTTTKSYRFDKTGKPIIKN